MNPKRFHKECLAIMREIGDRLGEAYEARKIAVRKESLR